MYNMGIHTLTYHLQPTKSFFAWSMNDANKRDLACFIQKGVCDYCVLPFEDGMSSGIERIEQTIEEEQGNIKRMRVLLTLYLKPTGSLSIAIRDIETRLKVIEEKWGGNCVFVS